MKVQDTGTTRDCEFGANRVLQSNKALFSVVDHISSEMLWKDSWRTAATKVINNPGGSYQMSVVQTSQRMEVISEKEHLVTECKPVIPSSGPAAQAQSWCLFW